MIEPSARPTWPWLILACLAVPIAGCGAKRQPVRPKAVQSAQAAPSAQVTPSTTAPSADPPSPLDDLIRDVCGKSVVLLGEESHHGSGRTLEVKSGVVRRLVAR